MLDTHRLRAPLSPYLSNISKSCHAKMHEDGASCGSSRKWRKFLVFKHMVKQHTKVGKEGIFRTTVGKFNPHDETSSNGLRLIDCDRLFLKADRRSRNQINHAVIDGRQVSSVLDVPTFQKPKPTRITMFSQRRCASDSVNPRTSLNKQKERSTSKNCNHSKQPGSFLLHLRT